MVKRNRVRSEEIKFFVTPKEKEELDARVKKSGLTRSEFLRKASKGVVIREKPQAELTDLLTELSHLGNNVNQIARKENSGYRHSTEFLIDLRDEIYKLITEIRKKVIS